MSLQDLVTLYEIAGVLSLLLLIFFVGATIRIIMLLVDIRLELRSMNGD